MVWFDMLLASKFVYVLCLGGFSLKDLFYFPYKKKEQYWKKAKKQYR